MSGVIEAIRSGNAPRRYRWVGSVTLAAVGIVSLAVQVAYLLRADASGARLVVGLVFPMLFAAVLVVSAGLLLRQDVGAYLPAIALWSLGGGAVLAAVEQLVVIYHRLLGIELVIPGFFLTFFATSGAVTGLFLGVYDARLRVTTAELDTERTRAQELSDRLAVLNRVLRHDLRSGVQSIQGYAGMLPEPEPETMSPDVPVERIRERAREMYQTAESARDVQELVSTDTTSPEPTDVVPLAAAVADSTDRRYPAVEVRTALPERAIARCHPSIKTALEELADNAVRHNDASDPVVTVSSETTDDTVRLSVTDNGPGLPEEEIAVVQRDEETPLEHASGVGLWVVKWIIDASDGSVSFDADDGTRVTIELDRAE